MTLDDLVTLYETTKGTGPEWVPGEDAVAAVRNLRREKLAAVVKALRDEMIAIWSAHGEPVDLLDEILGSDAGAGKVAGGSTREDGCSSEAGGFLAAESAVSTPATDPAPAGCDVCRGTGFVYVRTMHDPDGPREKEVCEECHAPAPAVCVWRVVQSPMNSFFLSGCTKKPIDGSENGYCPSCGKPIKFTEAKP